MTDSRSKLERAPEPVAPLRNTFNAVLKTHLHQHWRRIVLFQIALLTVGVFFAFRDLVDLFPFFSLMEVTWLTHLVFVVYTQQRENKRERYVAMLEHATQDLSADRALDQLSFIERLRANARFAWKENRRRVLVMLLLPFIFAFSHYSQAPFFNQVLITFGVWLAVVVVIAMAALCFETLFPRKSTRRQLNAEIQYARKRLANETLDGAVSIASVELETQGAITETHEQKGGLSETSYDHG